MMARVGDKQSFIESTSVCERLQYSSAQAFKSRIVLRRHRYHCRTIGISLLLIEDRCRESRKVTLVQGHDMANVGDFSEDESIFITERFRSVDDHNQKVGVGRFSARARDANQFDLVAGTPDARSVDEHDRNSVYADRLTQCVSSSARYPGHNGPPVSD